MIGIGKTGEWYCFFHPISFHNIRSLWSDGQDLCLTGSEFRIILTQAREVGAAIGSEETAQKNNHHIFALAKFRKAHCIAIDIWQRKIRGEHTRSDLVFTLEGPHVLSFDLFHKRFNRCHEIGRAFLVRNVSAVFDEHQLRTTDLLAHIDAILRGHNAIVITGDDQHRHFQLI